MYFVTSGKVDLCYERCGISLEKVMKGGAFGYVSFFSSRPREETAKSLEFTTVFQLRQEKFIERLENYQTEKVLLSPSQSPNPSIGDLLHHQ